MGIFDALKGAFVEDVPDNKPKATPGAKPAPSVHGVPFSLGTTAPTYPIAPPNMVAVAATADPKSLQMLEAKLQANVPPVYAAFLQSYDTLKEVIPDQGMLFKAALKASRTSVDQLTQAFDQLLALMEASRSEFTSNFEAKRNSTLSSIQGQIESTSKTIEARQSQLHAIQEEIVSLQNTQANGAAQLQTEQARLDNIRLGFEAALAQVVGRLNDQKAHIVSQPRI